jgi:subtilisin-like proprotein convertase family protein
MNNYLVAQMKNTDENMELNPGRGASAARAGLLKHCLAASALAWSLAASAQTFTTTMNFTVDALVPDGDPSGLASVQTVATPITNLTDVKVALKLSGTWNGDLYCFLAHGAGQAVLLNRLGRSDASNLGYRDAGLEVTFDDAATNGDIHIYRFALSGSQGTALPGPLTSAWAPDARVAAPANVLETDARSALLGSFNGVDPNGEWVLFVADLEAGDIHLLESWGLEITGEAAPAVPEQSLSQSAEGGTESVTVTGTVKNEVPPPVEVSTPAAPAVLMGITGGGDGIRLTFRGGADSSYQVERAAKLQGSATVWTKIGTVTTDQAGQGVFTDIHPTPGQGYYRAVGQ